MLCLIMSEWFQVRHGILTGGGKTVFKIPVSGWRHRVGGWRAGLPKNRKVGGR